VEDEMVDWVEILDRPLDLDESVKFISDPAAGGIDVFLGVTRAEGDLVALDYEAYAEMAQGQLIDLCGKARAKWGVLKIALLHRIGRVAIGEPSVIIAVSSAHRAQAFDACRFLIDELKRDVAIWKKEVWAGREGTWVHPR
jgi:molybdopterin synthase catalytic subunit